MGQGQIPEVSGLAQSYSRRGRPSCGGKIDALFLVYHIKEVLGKQALGKDESLFKSMGLCFSLSDRLCTLKDGPSLFYPFMTTGRETETSNDTIFQNKCRISL